MIDIIIGVALLLCLLAVSIQSRQVFIDLFSFFLVGYKPEEPNDRQQTMYYTLWEMKDMEKRGTDEVCTLYVNSNLDTTLQNLEGGRGDHPSPPPRFRFYKSFLKPPFK